MTLMVYNFQKRGILSIGMDQIYCDIMVINKYVRGVFFGIYAF